MCCSVMQGITPIFVPCVGVGAGLNERDDRSDLAIPSGNMQGSESFAIVFRIALCEESFNDSWVSGYECEIAPPVWVSACREKRTYGLGISIPGSAVKRR